MQGPKQAPRRHSKWRLFFFGACRRLTEWLGGRAFYRWRHLRPGRLLVRHEVLCTPDLPASLQGFSILHLSDLHAGPFLGAGDLAHISKALQGRVPHILVVTGDFITDSYEDALPMIPDLGLIETKLGGWAVFGNHDYRHHKHGILREKLAEQGIRVLQDEGQRIADLPLWISGLNDLEETSNPDPREARAGMAAGDLEIMLCHNPLAAKTLARENCVAILAGHSHGGQIDLPGLRDLGPTHPGLSVPLGATTLIVSRGLGVVGVPLRVGAPAELVWIELRRGDALEGRKTCQASSLAS